VATVLTLIFLPALYVTWFRIKENVPEQATELARDKVPMQMTYQSEKPWTVKRAT